MKRIVSIDPAWGITVVRISTGLIFVVHGVQKFVAGLGAVTAFFAKVGIPTPGVMGPFIAILELVGGVLLIVGLATRWIGLLFAIEMLVTTLWVQIPSRGWIASDLDRALLASSLLLVLAGGGKASVDTIWLEKDEQSVQHLSRSSSPPSRAL
jgi:putative oxidoreductase